MRTFLHLFKLLLSLAGILVSPSFIQPGSTILLVITPKSNLLISAVCHTATVGFIILTRALFLYFCMQVVAMLKRIGIGSILTFTCALYVLLIKCLDYTTSILGERYINIIAYLNLVIPISLA